MKISKRMTSLNDWIELNEALDAIDEAKEGSFGAKVDQSIKDTGVNPSDVVTDTREIENELDKSLDQAQEARQNGEIAPEANVLLVGLAGTAKTSRVKSWAKKNNMNLLILNTSTLEETDVTGIITSDEDRTKTVKLAADQFAPLNKPRSVLFLDEYNRGRKEVRASLLTLINDHEIDTGTSEEEEIDWDKEEANTNWDEEGWNKVDDKDKKSSGTVHGKKKLKNLWFVIAAVNPANTLYNTGETDTAENTRFREVQVTADKGNLLAHFKDPEGGGFAQKARIAREKGQEESALRFEGQLSLATRLLTDKRFQFDNEEDEEQGYGEYNFDRKRDGKTVEYRALNPRSFTNLLAATDGTKKSLLKYWNDYCNFNKKPIVEEILKDYQDVADIVPEDSVEDTEEMENPEAVKNNSQIENALDHALKVAILEKRSGTGDYTNVLLTGPAGSGKTGRVKSWAEDHNINLCIVTASTLDETDLTGIITFDKDRTSTKRLSTSVFDALKKPRSVLFLDEFNRARPNVRGTLLTLINDHLIDIGTEEDNKNNTGISGKREFKNMLFTIAAINPAGGAYQTRDLDPAEMSRFRGIDVQPDPGNTLEYIKKKLAERLENFEGLAEAVANGDVSGIDIDSYGGSEEKVADVLNKRLTAIQRRAELAETLLGNPNFEFSSEEDEANGANEFGKNYHALNPRTFTNLIFSLRNGTKKEFLDTFNQYCDPAKKGLMKQLLNSYKDADKKANSVFKKKAADDFSSLMDFLNS